MKIEVIATARGVQGTGASRRLRRANKVPGVVYGGSGKPAMIEIDHNPLYHAMRKEAFHASILDLTVDGKAEQVLLRDYQMHAFKQIVMHIDFQRVDPAKEIHMKVPLHFKNQDISPAVKQSAAIVSHVLNELEVACLPKDLPEFIEIDLKDLTVTAPLHVLDLKLPQGVRAVLGKKDNPTVVMAKVAGAEEVASDAPTAAEVPATAQKAPDKAAAPAGKDGKAAGGKDAKAAAPAPAKKK
jgi:large subunit ribosomal protein L25